jgi:aminopeptidase 2
MCRAHAGAEMAGGGVNIQGRELLPTNVIPKHYNLTLEPDFKKLTFEGNVVIDLEVAEDSNSISLHTLEIDIHSAKVSSAGTTIRLTKHQTPRSRGP